MTLKLNQLLLIKMPLAFQSFPLLSLVLELNHKNPQLPLKLVIRMFSVLVFFGRISMYSFSAKPDYIGTGKENMNARNPADADPCVAK